MPSFDEQIRMRRAREAEIGTDARAWLTYAVTGKGAPRPVDPLEHEYDAVSAILHYFHVHMGRLPDGVTDPEERLSYLLRPSGVQTRPVSLTDKWYASCIGPLLMRMDDGRTVALIPRGTSGYLIKDAATGKSIPLTANRAKQLPNKALCFYRPLPEKCSGAASLLKFIGSVLSAADIALILIATSVIVLLGFLTPATTKVITGHIIPAGNVSLLWSAAVVLLGALVSMTLVSQIKNLLICRVRTKVCVWTEAAVMARVLSLPARFFSGGSAGELTYTVMGVRTLCETLTELVFSVGMTAAFSLIYLTQIVRYTPALAVPALGIVAVMTAYVVLMTVFEARQRRKKITKDKQLEGIAGAILNGIQKIRLAGAENRAFGKWARYYAESARATYNPPLILKLADVIRVAIPMLGTIVLYSCAIASQTPPGDYLAFNAAYGMLTGAFLILMPAAPMFGMLRPMLDDVAPILQAEPETGNGKVSIGALSGAIEINNVSFRYQSDDPDILSGLSIKIKSGEYIGIVGRTGCGKSTLLRLLLGFERAQTGAIYYDGIDIAKADVRSLRQKIGTVLQNGSLITASIYQNIVVTAPRLTEQDAWAAAEIADIADDIRAMPMKMHTIISENSNVSGGQRQRLMIARAIAPNPKILLMDEATSALDNISQKRISDALDAMGCTRIVIAHRLSTVRNCDRILVMDGGRIAEEGNYDALIARGGLFAELVKRQQIDSV